MRRGFIWYVGYSEVQTDNGSNMQGESSGQLKYKLRTVT